MRPLDFLHSIKLKLGVVIVAAVVVTVGVVRLGERLGLSPLISGFAAAAFALAVVQVLAHGMTSPLREMVAAARAMARGDYSRRITSTSRDEVGELARAFNTMASELDEADRMRRDLVANASHELRTPIGALRARLENLVDGVEHVDAAGDGRDARAGRAARLPRRAAARPLQARVGSGAARADARFRPARCSSAWRATGASRRASATCCSSPRPLRPISRWASTSSGWDRCSRTSSATPSATHPRAARCASTSPRRPGRLRIAVSDQGPGIAADEIERVFERFYRSDRARSADRGGAGLGLAIARWIVELHGGTIHAEQAEPTGCRMIVELPA